MNMPKIPYYTIPNTSNKILKWKKIDILAFSTHPVNYTALITVLDYKLFAVAFAVIFLEATINQSKFTF